MPTTSHFDTVLEQVETLPPADQQALIDLVHKHLIEQRRAEIAANIELSRQEYRAGQVRSGNTDDVMAELDN
jgi:hypothetical protein